MRLPEYRVEGLDQIPSPAVLVFRELLERNLDQMIALSGSPDRLRPHCKTHKTREIIKLLLARGVERHKASTLREVAMCLEAGARDVILAYSLVGPAIEQFVDLAAQAPEARLTSLVDCDEHVDWLARAARARGITVGAMVDLDTGFHRTGIPVGESAANLYARVARTEGLQLAGLHVYDAQNATLAEPAERRSAIERTLESVMTLVETIGRAGLAIPEILCGGSPTFAYYAPHGPPVVVSPGTAVFSDHGYSSTFSDLDTAFTPAAVVFGRVISRPGPGYVTLDIGTKAIAPDPPLGKRGRVIGLEDTQTVIHNEEHWTLASNTSDLPPVGHPVFVLPTHVCPCTNLHPVLYVIGPEGHLEDRWKVVARQRPLTL
ncbi:MAG TPA: alanine racemase [Chloroflexota bacterium]|nr:alanine racemase [Chloroflexota bacterium]